MMKKITFSIVMAILSISFIPFQNTRANPEIPDRMVPVPMPADEAKADSLIARLNEIKSMDKEEMNSSEKKKLRKEVKLIESELKQVSGGVYISGAAALVIVILLLILLL